jgi:hypothetical protein
MADVAKIFGPDGSVLKTAEILKDSTPVFEDIPWMEGNLPTGEKTALTTELPESSWIGFYQGVAASKGKQQTQTFNTAMLRGISETDVNLLKMSKNESVVLMKDAKRHIMGMGHAFEDQLIYGSKDEPEKFPGLAATYDHLSTSETDVGFNVISGGGTGSDNTSIWFIYWGENNIYGIYPQGSQAGISKKDYGQMLDEAPDGNGDYEVRKIIYRLDGGLAIPDWGSVVRIANIDASELSDAGESTFDGAPLLNLLIKAQHKFKSRVKTSGARGFIYCNRTVMTALDLIAVNKPTLGISVIRDVNGEPMTNFRGFPLRLAERILDNEAQVTA